MSALSDRIAEVLREHRWLDTEWACHCGARSRLADHAAHVAERIEAELGLREETTTSYETSNWPPISRTGNEAPPNKHLVRRWVSAWMEVEK